MKTALTIGRYRMLHKGHKEYLIKLVKEYDKLVICIGSCFEHGTDKNAILPVFVEKMLRAMLDEEKIDNSKYIITCMSDYDSFDEWFDNLLNLCNKYEVNNFVTGNKKDILNELEVRDYKDLNIINPEVTSSYNYHASDVRLAFSEGNWDMIDSMVPDEVKPMICNSIISSSLEMAKRGEAVPFVSGRQTIDYVFLLKNKEDGELYVLGGKRSSLKETFPDTYGLIGGDIKLYETAYDALCRNVLAKSNLEISILKNTFEPAVIKFSNVANSPMVFLNFSGLYSNDDLNIIGKYGGSSQAFASLIEDDINKYKKVIKANDELSKIDFYKVEDFIKMDLAYEQKDMILDAVDLLSKGPILNNNIVYSKKLRR